MFKLSDNYYHRKCYLDRDQTPTQSMIKNKMGPALANVYFQMSSPKEKVIVGLQPPLKGGGTNWSMPPEEILKGRHVLKPIHTDHIPGYLTLLEEGKKIKLRDDKAISAMNKQVILEHDLEWRQKVKEKTRQHYNVYTAQEIQENTRRLQDHTKTFEMLCRLSFAEIENMVTDASMAEIQRFRVETQQGMSEHYAKLLTQQSTLLYEEYEAKYEKEKEKIKAQFVQNVEQLHTDAEIRVHDINSEKHLTIEKLRQLLQSQNLACQLFVALKEREECQKELEHANLLHSKKVKGLEQEIHKKDEEINKAADFKQKCEQYERVWKKKICYVMKKFQVFVEYCLRTVPQYADFFLNLEKLVLIQFAEVLDQPHRESIIECKPPEPQPRPFYLFCDKGSKPEIQRDFQSPESELKSSNASILPVIVINENCIFSTCDNFEMFSEKVSEYLAGNRGNDLDVDDDHNYDLDVPFKNTERMQLQELALESSLMQILKEDIPEAFQSSIACQVCNIRHCFCTTPEKPKPAMPTNKVAIGTKPKSISPKINKKLTSKEEFPMHRGPKLEECIHYSMLCKTCPFVHKKTIETMPTYMIKRSPYEPVDIPHYETCSVEELKALVNLRRRPEEVKPETPADLTKKDASTQYSDQCYEDLCECFSDDAIAKIRNDVKKVTQIFELADSTDASFLNQRSSSFLTERRKSLEMLYTYIPKIQDILIKHN